MSTVKRIAKNTAFTFSGDILSKILTMILTIFITRFFTEVEFGKLSFALSFTGLFIILIDLGIRLLIIRSMACDQKNASKYISNALMLKAVSSFIVFWLIVLTINLMGYPPDTKLAVYLGALIIILESLSGSLGSVFQAFQKMKYPAINKVVRVLLRFCITLPLLFLGYGLIPVLLAYLIVQIINFLMYIFQSRRFIKLEFKPDYQLMKQLIIGGFPFLLSSAFVVVYFRIDITMLSIMKGDAVVGWYSASYNLIDAIISLTMALNAALLPVAILYYNESKEKLIRLYRTAAKVLFTVSLPIAVGGTLLAQNIILFLYKEKYYNSIIALQILLWALIPLFINYLLGNLLIAIKKEKYGVPALFINCIVNVGLNLILIPKYSYVGAAISTVVSEIVYFSMYYCIISKNLKFVNIFGLMIKPMIAALTMGLLISILINKIHFILIIIISIISYFGLLYLIKGISEEDKIMLLRLIKKSEK